MPALPWMGLGLSSNMSASARPRPYQLPRGAFDYVEYSAPVSFDDAAREASLFPEMLAHRRDVPVLFHPVHLDLFGPELEHEHVLAAIADHVARVGSPWVSNDLAWWHTGEHAFPGYLYLAPPLTEAGIDACVAHVSHVQASLPVPLLLENPAVIDPRGDLHVLDFMAEVHARSGLDLLLDVGHLYAHQLARGLALLDGLERFPWEAIVELHVAGGLVIARDGRRFYLDDHPQPIVDDVYQLLEHVLPRCTRLRALTYEGDGHPEALALDVLARLRAMLDERPRPEAVEATTPKLGAGAHDPALAWRVYDEAYGGAPGADVVAHEVEAAFRRAVLAERLDRSFPMTRLLVAPTQHELGSFAASRELRRAFEPPGRSLPEAFAAWARRRLMELGEDALAAVLAFESWARHESAHAGGQPHFGSFPVDLSELLHATKVLKQSVALRGALGPAAEAPSFEALRDIARRAPQRRWRVHLERRGERVVVTGEGEASAG